MRLSPGSHETALQVRSLALTLLLICSEVQGQLASGPPKAEEPAAAARQLEAYNTGAQAAAAANAGAPLSDHTPDNDPEKNADQFPRLPNDNRPLPPLTPPPTPPPTAAPVTPPPTPPPIAPVAPVAPPPPPPGGLSTILSAPVSAGATSLLVTSQAGFMVGTSITIAQDTPMQEFANIVAFGSPAIVLQQPLQFSHAAGATVSPTKVLTPTANPQGKNIAIGMGVAAGVTALAGIGSGIMAAMEHKAPSSFLTQPVNVGDTNIHVSDDKNLQLGDYVLLGPKVVGKYLGKVEGQVNTIQLESPVQTALPQGTPMVISQGKPPDVETIGGPVSVVGKNIPDETPGQNPPVMRARIVDGSQVKDQVAGSLLTMKEAAGTFASKAAGTFEVKKEKPFGLSGFLMAGLICGLCAAVAGGVIYIRADRRSQRLDMYGPYGQEEGFGYDPTRFEPGFGFDGDEFQQSPLMPCE